MPVTFDATGWQRADERTWTDPRTGDYVVLAVSGQVPDLPPLLHDVAQLQHQLTVDNAVHGTLVEADVVRLGGLPAVYQLTKKPLRDRPAGVMYQAAFVLPRAHCSVVLMMRAQEGTVTGTREAMVATEVGPQNAHRPHPYAQGHWANVADDPYWDNRFPDHPLSRARRWVRQVLTTARLDPRLALLPPFPAPPGVPVPAPPPTPVPTRQLGEASATVLLGLPVGDLICLSHGDGGTSFWRLADPNLILGHAALDEFDRVDVPGRGACEMGVLRAGAGMLHLSGAQAVPVSPVDPETALDGVDPDGYRLAFGFLADRALRAAVRGEALTVGHGGWHAPAWPYLQLTMRRGAQDWDAFVRTAPIPVFAQAWAAHPVEGDTQVFRSPGVDHGMGEAINMALVAIETWGTHPLLLSLAFGPHPDQ